MPLLLPLYTRMRIKPNFCRLQNFSCKLTHLETKIYRKPMHRAESAET